MDDEIARDYPESTRSTMEKIMTDANFYEKEPGGVMEGQTLVVRLSTQYRMHASIYWIPNLQFYDGQIKVCQLSF